jgi:hypothetical protein
MGTAALYMLTTTYKQFHEFMGIGYAGNRNVKRRILEYTEWFLIVVLNVHTVFVFKK